MLESNPNVASAIFAGMVSVICTFGIVVFTDKRKSRTNAHDREVEARADYVELIQNRVGELERRLDECGRRETTMTERFRQDLFELERRYRHLVSNLIMYSQALAMRLKKLGHPDDIPAFNGWERFMEEGGTPRAEWQEVMQSLHNRDTEC